MRGRTLGFAAVTVGAISLNATGQAARAQDTRVSKLASFAGEEVRAEIALSPDGRWLAYVINESNTIAHLWVRDVKGGAPIRITSGVSANFRPIFSPQGDRIFYYSTMPQHDGDTRGFIVSVGFDPKTGQARGTPRQVTLDGVANAAGPRVDVSRDGKWLAYLSCCDPQRGLRVVSASGGTARTLVTAGSDRRRLPNNITWSEDGASVFYTRMDSVGEKVNVFRVARDGGIPRLMWNVDDGTVLLLPGAKQAVQMIASGPGGRKREGRLLDISGREIARFAMPDNLRALRSTLDGRAFIGMTTDDRAELRIRSLEGGPGVTVSKATSYDWPGTWTADSTLFYVAKDSTQLSGNIMIGVASDGTQRYSVALPTDSRGATEWAGVVPGSVLYSVRHGPQTYLMARSFVNGKTVELSSKIYRGVGAGLLVRGPGGTYNNDGNDVFIYETNGRQLELRAVSPGKASRLLLAVPFSRVSRSIGVYGNRVAYVENAGDSVRLMLSPAATERPITLGTFQSESGPGEIVFSHDGSRVAFSWNEKLYVVTLTSDGRPAGPPQSFDLSLSWYYEVSWLPGNRGVSVIGEPKGGGEIMIVAFNFDDPTHPVFLTQSDGVSVFGHLVSLDGKLDAYPFPRGSRGTMVYKISLQ
jgi:WD40-like Beta Propeller Repeat